MTEPEPEKPGARNGCTNLPTTEARAIEKLIGWKPGMTDYGHGWHTADGRECERAEVDDLLAWLRENGYDVTVRTSRTHFPKLCVVKPGQHTHRVKAPTLRDALVAAVREVAAQ